MIESGEQKRIETELSVIFKNVYGKDSIMPIILPISAVSDSNACNIFLKFLPRSGIIKFAQEYLNGPDIGFANRLYDFVHKAMHSGVDEDILVRFMRPGERFNPQSSIHNLIALNARSIVRDSILYVVLVKGENMDNDFIFIDNTNELAQLVFEAIGRVNLRARGYYFRKGDLVLEFKV